MGKLAAPNKSDSKACRFVDQAAIIRVLGDEKAAELGVTRESVAAMVKGLVPEPLGTNPHARYSKFVTFSDGSCAAQVISSRRWEVWG